MRQYVSPLRFALIAALTTFPALNASAIVFNDGGVHVIDAGNSYPLEPVDLLNGPGGVGTTLNVLDGGSIATLVCGDSSTSSVQGVSTLVIFGGEIGCLGLGGRNAGSGINLFNHSSVFMLDGDVAYTQAHDTAEIVVLGGTLGSANISDDSRLRIIGGAVNTLVQNGGIGDGSRLYPAPDLGRMGAPPDPHRGCDSSGWFSRKPKRASRLRPNGREHLQLVVYTCSCFSKDFHEFGSIACFRGQR